MHVYEIRPRKDKRGVDLIPMRCHSAGGPTAVANAIGYAEAFQLIISRRH